MTRRGDMTRYCSLHVVEFPFFEECPYCIQALQAGQGALAVAQEVHKSSYNEGYEDGYAGGRSDAVAETGNRASEAYDRGYSEGLAAGRRIAKEPDKTSSKGDA